MVVFNQLGRKSMLRIVDLRLANVAARLVQRRMKLNVDDAARGWWAQTGFSAFHDARSITAVVRTDVLFPLAQKLLVGTMW